MSIGITRDEKVKFHILEIQGPTGPSFQLLQRAGDDWAFGTIIHPSLTSLDMFHVVHLAKVNIVYIP